MIGSGLPLGGFTPPPMLAMAALLAAVGAWAWRRGRVRPALLAGAFAGLGAVAAAAPPLADQVEQLVGRVQARTPAQGPAAKALLDAAAGRHEREMAEAQALANGAPERLVAGFAALADTGLADPDPLAEDLRPAAGQPRGVVYVAVSFSMPAEDLRRLGRDAQTAGATVVIQGLVKGSFKATLAAARQVFDEGSLGGIAIDPNVFRAFGVTAVPTFIAAAAPVQPCPRGLECIPPAPPHDRVTGNIHLAEALKVLSGGEGAGAVARAAADRLAP